MSGFQVSTQVLAGTAGIMRTQAITRADNRRNTPWRYADECGADAAAQAVQQANGWYRSAWGSVEDGVTAMAATVEAVVDLYEATDRTVTDEFDIKVF